MSENTSSSSGSALVTMAWLAVVAGVVGNTVASVAATSIGVNLALGALTAAGVLILVLNWLHRR